MQYAAGLRRGLRLFSAALLMTCASSYAGDRGYFFGRLGFVKGHESGQGAIPIEQVGNGAVFGVEPLSSKDWFPAIGKKGEPSFFGTRVDRIRFYCPPVMPRGLTGPTLVVPSAAQSETGMGFEIQFPCDYPKEKIPGAMKRMQDLVLISKLEGEPDCEGRSREGCLAFKKWVIDVLTGEKSPLRPITVCEVQVEYGIKDPAPVDPSVAVSMSQGKILLPVGSKEERLAASKRFEADVLAAERRLKSLGFRFGDGKIEYEGQTVLITDADRLRPKPGATPNPAAAEDFALRVVAELGKREARERQRTGFTDPNRTLASDLDGNFATSLDGTPASMEMPPGCVWNPDFEVWSGCELPMWLREF